MFDSLSILDLSAAYFCIDGKNKEGFGVPTLLSMKWQEVVLGVPLVDSSPH